MLAIPFVRLSYAGIVKTAERMVEILIEPRISITLCDLEVQFSCLNPS